MVAPALERFQRNSTVASQRWRSSDFLPEEQVEDDDEKNDSADAKIHCSLPGWIAFGRENDWGIVRLRCASLKSLGLLALYLVSLHPLTVVEPLVLTVQDGLPEKRIVDAPRPSTRAVPVTFASIVAVPSVLIAAS